MSWTPPRGVPDSGAMLRPRHAAPPRSLLFVMSLAASLALAGAGGCGGDDDGDQVTPTDAGDDSPDAALPVCTDFAALDLGALDPIPGAEATQRANPEPPEGNPDAKTLELIGTAANGEKPDIISIELWDGYGAFEGGDITVGEWTIEGDETAVLSCGICIYIFADSTLADGTLVDSEKDYIATGGTITVDSITTNFTGSVADLTFTEIDVNSDMGTPLADGCTTAVPTASFDVAITLEE